jgi:hypothetical protein
MIGPTNDFESAEELPLDALCDLEGSAPIFEKLAYRDKPSSPQRRVSMRLWTSR